MSEVWYEEVEATTELMQGDLIPNCPLISWKAEQVQLGGEGESTRLQAMVEPILADTVIMTQACDLVLCPHVSLNEYHPLWGEAMKGKNQNLTEKAWRNHCDDIRDGYVWNLAILNAPHCRFSRDLHCPTQLS
jgi:hypothetical protein